MMMKRKPVRDFSGDARRWNFPPAITRIPATFARLLSYLQTTSIRVNQFSDFTSHTRLDHFVMSLSRLRKKFSSMGNLRKDDTRSDIPSNIPCPDPSSIPRNILAFRTITTMLAKLQPNQPEFSPSTSGVSDVSSDVRRGVRISDALAHLAIVDHEVVAVTTQYTSEGMNVVACASISEDPTEKPPQTDSNGLLEHIIGLIFVKNPRKDDPPVDPVVTYPIIISPTQPEDMGSQTLHDYIHNLDGSS